MSKREGGFLSSLFNFFKFSASAVVGIPVACSLSAVIGSLYLAAEMTDIIETNVKSNFKGDKKVYHNPFYQKIAQDLGMMFGKTWSEFGLYAPLSVLKETNTIIKENTSNGFYVSSIIKELAEKDPKIAEELKKLPDIETNPEYYKKAAITENKDFVKKLKKYKEESTKPDVIKNMMSDVITPSPDPKETTAEFIGENQKTVASQPSALPMKPEGEFIGKTTNHSLTQ